MRQVGGILGGGDDRQSMGHKSKPLRLGHTQIPCVSLKLRKLPIDLAPLQKLLAISDLSECVPSSFLFPPLAL